MVFKVSSNRTTTQYLTAFIASAICFAVWSSVCFNLQLYICSQATVHVLNTPLNRVVAVNTNPFLSTLPGDGNGQTIVTMGELFSFKSRMYMRVSEHVLQKSGCSSVPICSLRLVCTCHSGQNLVAARNVLFFQNKELQP